MLNVCKVVVYELLSLDGVAEEPDGSCSGRLIMAALRPEARGTVKVTSTDPRRPPALRFDYLATEADRRFRVDALRLVRDVFAQPAFADLDGGETYPGRAVDTDEQIVEWARRTVETNMHPTSTCRLGVDDRSVLDPATIRYTDWRASASPTPRRCQTAPTAPRTRRR